MTRDLRVDDQETVERLLPLALQEDPDVSLVELAAAGGHLKEVRDCIIEMARTRPAKNEICAISPSRPINLTMCQRGEAIDAMRYLKDYPEECVPVLIEAIETFEEFDPDEFDFGPLARIVRTLEAFGDSAAPAVVPVAEALAKSGGEYDYYPVRIVRFLGSLGPLAGGALPYLEDFRKATKHPDEPLPDLEGGPADQIGDLAGWAIQRIWGLPG